MGLASSLTTALSGLNAAEAKIDVLGNNLANSQTVGFKESDVMFSTQFFQTLSMGSAPTEGNGGVNPRQFGLGTRVAGISTNHSQGSITLSNNPTDLAIQGNGMFLVQGAGGETLYSRSGVFSTNADHELVTPNGNRLLGYGVDENFQLQTGGLTPVTIPKGMDAVAQATTEVTMEGVLPPNGTIADTAAVIQSQPMTVSYLLQADTTGMTGVLSAVPDLVASTINSSEGGGSHPAEVTYGYRFVFVDSSGTESRISVPMTVDIPQGNGLADNVIQINDLPTPPPHYEFLRVYRTAPDGNEYFRLTDLGPAATTFTDTNATALSGDVLDQTTLSGGYTYRVTFSVAGHPETRPSPPLGPISVSGGRIQLQDFPLPPVPGPGDQFPAYDTINIYRNVPNDPDTFFYVTSGSVGDNFTDAVPDATITNLTLPGNRVLDKNGPPVDVATLLSEILIRNGNEYVPAFELGPLTLQLRKGGDAGHVLSKTLQISDQTRFSDLMLFMEQATGIVRPNSENGVPLSLNKISGETGSLTAGVSIVNGALRIVSNNGSINSININASGLTVEGPNGPRPTGLNFSQLQSATGTTAATDFVVYDSLGIPLQVRVSVAMESQDSNATVYRWFADSPDHDASSGHATHVGTGLIKLDGQGRLQEVTNTEIAIGRANMPADHPLSFNLNWEAISGLAADFATVTATKQDGHGPGTLTSFSVNRDGSITGVFSNGTSHLLGQIMVAVFANQQGLIQRGQNLYAPGVNAGMALRRPGDGNAGELIAGALELSNVDIGRNLIDLGLASTLYRGNSRVISTTQQLLDELLNLRR